MSGGLCGVGTLVCLAVADEGYYYFCETCVELHSCVSSALPCHIASYA